MAAAAAWWAIGANVQPVAGVGTSYSYFQGTQAQAQARAATLVDGTVTGPFATKAAAQAAVKAGKTTPSPQASRAPQLLTGLDAIGNFFSALSQANTWIRVGKVVIGGLLLVIGMVHITGADNKIASMARKVPVPI